MSHASGSILLEMRNISKSFGGVRALREVSFTCRRGQVHALVGENGAGKSTLIKILAGVYPADSGEIIYKGKHYNHLSTRAALDNGIRIIYQELNLIPYMNVAENIFLGREPRTPLGLIDNRRLYAEAADLIRRLGVNLALTTPVGELSVASQQMIEIAKALSQQADLIVMDEPSAILGGNELEQLFAIINLLIAQGVTIVYISHRLDEVFQIAHDVTVLKDGVVVSTCPIAEVTRASLIQMMVGRSLEEVFPHGSKQRGDPVLIAEDISAEPMLRRASLTLYAGEILGLAGMVGAGRSELALALFGAIPLRTGKIILKGKLLNDHDPAHAVQAGLVLVPEDRKSQGLFLELPIRINLTLPILKRLAKYGIIQRQQETEAIQQAKHDLQIHMSSMDQEVQYLSGGNQQKIVLAKWLATSPAVVILDEPTRGIDVGAKFEIYQLMRQLTDRGVAILMISSELMEILGMSDRIMIMRDGEIVGELSCEEATEAGIIELATTNHVTTLSQQG
jgi:ribose transport system ATP-binding protein